MSGHYGENNISVDCAVDGSGSVCDDTEMGATERELAEDAAWKRIQQNTFTRLVRNNI